MSDFAADRFARQIALPQIGVEGQRRLAASHALIVGCGALGSAAAELLARAGIGALTIVDRDVVEESNLQRQFLFDEEDVRRGSSKAEAAKARIARINRAVRVRSAYDDFGPANARRYAEGVDVIIDGLDNFESRYLLNDLAVATGTPYVYGAAVGTRGMLAVVRPALGACLRCIAPQPPAPGVVETCQHAGVLGAATALIAAFEATEATKLLVGAEDAVERDLLSIDLWRGEFRRIGLADARDPTCPCCGLRRFEFLDGDALPAVEVFCGRSAVQLRPSRSSLGSVGLADLAKRCGLPAPAGGGPLVIGAPDGAESLEVFSDGRIVVRGTTDPERARALAARLVGL
jgi:adenylyltransferase/sulfurtransferase